MDKGKLYLPNLNGIRCIAAILVIIHHIEQIKFIYKIDNYWDKSEFIGIIGHLGVVLFFVLSGFLITYLLLMEEQTTNKISVKQFYIRRALRIWPLYFLIIILSLFILPHFSFFTLPGFGKDVVLDNLVLKVLLYFALFANLALPLLGMIPYASHTWSIGTEEQFYIVWPVMMKFFKKNRISLMLSVVVLYILFGKIIISDYLDFLPYRWLLISLWNGFNVDCMAIGGFFAVASFKNMKILKVFQNNFLFYALLMLLIVLMIYGYHFPKYHNECYSVLFGIIILNFATNKQIFLSLENKLFNYLGKISYGLYMFHPIAIVVSIKICLLTNLLSNYFIYPMSILLTILMAGFSYAYFEARFLAYKTKFSSITNGDVCDKLSEK